MWASTDFQVQIMFIPVKFGGVTIKIKGQGDVGHYDLVIKNALETEFPVSITVNSFPRDDSYPVKMATHAINRITGRINRKFQKNLSRRIRIVGRFLLSYSKNRCL
jgi:hypothetical protein